MRKEFDASMESFDDFAGSLSSGDTAIICLSGIAGFGGVEELLAGAARLQEQGVVVRAPSVAWFDRLLCEGASLSFGLPRLAAMLDREECMRMASALSAKGEGQRGKVPDEVALFLKVHRLVKDRGLTVVEACGRVHCKPTLYYINRHKIEKFYGR